MSEIVKCRGYEGECDNEMKEQLMDGGLCPRCAELRSIAFQRHHQATRDPQVEPW